MEPVELWIEKLDMKVHQQPAHNMRSESLQDVGIREDLATRIAHILTTIASDRTLCAPSEMQVKLLTATKVLMRDRRGIDKLLSIETLSLWLTLADGCDVSVQEESLKCIINSIYSRPEFVRDAFLPNEIPSRLLGLASRAGPASFHLLVWKTLLVSCDADEMIQWLCASSEAWTLIHATLFYSLHADTIQWAFHHNDDRCLLVIELLKLLAVMINAFPWSTLDARVSTPEIAIIANCLKLLGQVHVDLLRLTPSSSSRFTPSMIEIKNKALEILLFIPRDRLGFFIQQQESALEAMIDHFYAMLMLIRIEHTRAARDLSPVLLACHHLTTTGDPNVRQFFYNHLFPNTENPITTNIPHSQKLFIHKHALFFLTCLDTSVKRYMGEWLYLLCNQDAKEFTKHTGIGNAIGILRIKGLA